MNNWQPIKTAPKDGTPILAYIPCPWDNESPSMCAVVEWKRMYGRDAVWVLSAYDAFRFNPTHWMPLPEPPLE